MKPVDNSFGDPDNDHECETMTEERKSISCLRSSIWRFIQ